MEEKDFWKAVGILHDLDFEMYPEHEMEKVLYAVDELTGLIGAFNQPDNRSFAYL